MLKYLSLSKELQERIREERRSGTAQDFSCREEDALRRDPGREPLAAGLCAGCGKDHALPLLQPLCG